MDSKSVEWIKLPPTPEGTAVYKYLQAQVQKDFSGADEFFTDDIVFNDVMYAESGKSAVVKSLGEYVKKYLTSFRVEAAVETGVKDRFLVLCFIGLRGLDKELATCELVSLRGGKIERVDNCFDADKLKRLFH
eukprot:GFKZ01000092.1.p1 GENE.GFKZ01000092.1~~GFKZ01000092.1.p1  ORF type:complete len:133 (-),score=30.17 GFKZ01000092.1:501-899(-)